MNNKKVFCKLSIIVGLLCNSDIKSAEAVDLQGYYYIPFESFQVLNQDEHPLSELIVSCNLRSDKADLVFTEGEKALIVNNKQYLNVLLKKGDCYYTMIHEKRVINNRKNLFFLLECGANLNMPSYEFREGAILQTSFLYNFIYHGPDWGNLAKDDIELMLSYGADANKGSFTVIDQTVKSASVLTMILDRIFHVSSHSKFKDLDCNLERNFSILSLLISSGADIKQARKELLQTTNNGYFRCADECFKLFLKKIIEKKMGIITGKSLVRTLQARELGARLGVIVPGFNYKN